ncbi:hypothetical protein [Streptomyces lavendulae]
MPCRAVLCLLTGPALGLLVVVPLFLGADCRRAAGFARHRVRCPAAPAVPAAPRPVRAVRVRAPQP